MANINVRINDNSSIVRNEYKARRKRILDEIGLRWQRHVVIIITQKNIIDTGHLKGSMTYIPKDTYVDLGTNVTYAKYHELGLGRFRARPFIRPAILDYVQEYRNVIIKIMKG